MRNQIASHAQKGVKCPLKHSYMLVLALIGNFFMKKKWMVQSDVIAGEVSCQQKFFLATFFEEKFTLALTNG